jgi:Oxidoreductase molybdopterin binding domain
MKLESSDARKSAALATSRGWPIRPIGISDTNWSLTSLGTPTKTPVSRHDCVEGWSCIGKWKGVQLSALLDRARLKPDARYIVFYCADLETGEEKDKYYESIGLVDAYHPQTILAYEMNDQTLPIANGLTRLGVSIPRRKREGWRSTDSIILICRHSMSGFERASQFLGRHIRRCVAVVDMPGRGMLVQGRSRIGRAALSIGLLVALRVIGEGRGERGGADHQRSGGSEGYGSVAKHGGFSFVQVAVTACDACQASKHPSPKVCTSGCRTRRTLPRVPIAAGGLNRRFLRVAANALACLAVVSALSCR